MLNYKNYTYITEKVSKEYFTFPAASSHHHNFVSGLSYHVVTMLRQAKALCDIYPILNRSLLYSGIILHDLGKVKRIVRTSCNIIHS